MDPRRHASLLVALSLLAACASPATAPATGGGSKPRPRPADERPRPPDTGRPPGLVPPPAVIAPVPPTAAPGPVVGTPPTPGLVPGGGLVSDQGASIVGKVLGPAGVVSNNGAGVISNNGGNVVSNNGGNVVSNGGGGYRLRAIDQVPGVGLAVALRRADGTPVRDAAGAPIVGVTGADGGYRLPYAGSDQHVLVAVTLPAARGTMLALVPRGAIAAPTQVDVDLVSTLTVGYILEKYVAAQPDPVAVLERLPPALEVETRAVVAAAVAREAAPPESLAAPAVVATVERLRAADPVVDAQLETVRRVLLAGLSDQGAGLPADDVETDANDVAFNPAGEVVFSGASTRRVWKKDAAGKLTPIAGSGLNPLVVMPQAGAPAPGDGGPALEAYINPVAIAYEPDGTLLIGDFNFERVRQVSPAGVIGTRVSHGDWDEMRDMLREPDGGLVVATHSAVWRVPPAGEPALVAGVVRAFDAAAWTKVVPAGDGGPAVGAVFRNIQSVARDPATGDLYVYDGLGSLRRIRGGTIDHVAGGAVSGFSGDGGPASAASLGVTGAVGFDGEGGLIVSDGGNHRLRRIKDGVITTIAGSGDATLAGDGGSALAAGLIEPRGVNPGPDGALWFADQGFVRRYADGTLSTPVGGLRGIDRPRPAREVQLFEPYQIRYDAPAHAMWVADSRHLWRWDLTGDRLAAVFGRGPAGEPFVEGGAALTTSLFYVRSPILEGPDRWLVSAVTPDTFVSRVLRVEGGRMTTIAGGSLVAGAADTEGPALGATLALLDTTLVPIGDWIYYNVTPTGRIRRFQVGGNVEKWGGYGTSKADGTPARDFDFERVYALALGPDGMLYVGDFTKIWRIDLATTQVTRVAGTTYGFAGDGGPALDAQFSYASDFAWDAAGNLYFCSPDQACVRRIRKDTGVIERIAGEQTPNLAGKTVDTGLASPTGLAFDRDGDLYITDSRHGQVKVVPKADLAP